MDYFYLDILRDIFINVYRHSRVRSFLINKVESAISKVIYLLGYLRRGYIDIYILGYIIANNGD